MKRIHTLLAEGEPCMKAIAKTKQPKPAKDPRRASPLIKGIRRDWMLILIALPAVLCIFIFSYIPMGGILYAFQDVSLRKSFWTNEWVGPKWFKQFFSSIYIGRLIKNTLILNIWSLIAGTTVEIGLALIFNEVKNGKYKKFTQSCTYFPNFISTTVVVGMMINMLNPNTGVLSLLFQNVFGMDKVDLFVQPNAFRPMYIISGIWQGAGWGSIIYLGAINGIDPGLYDAAAIDGAGRLQRIRHVTLPGMKPVIIICLIMHIGGLLNHGSGKIILMYSSATYETADVISTFVYRYGLTSANYGYGTAVGLFNSIVSLILLVTANKVSKKVSEVSMF